MPAIEPAPETWFTDISPRGRPPCNSPRDSGEHPPVGMTPDSVRCIVSGLRRGIAWAKIAAAVGQTRYVVFLVAKNRRIWAKLAPKLAKQRRSLRVHKGWVRPPQVVAPKGVEIVPPYRCDDHLTVFRPCQICRVRHFRRN